jgi:hypothetical protein
MKILEGDELVQSVSLYVDRHWLLHAYVVIFVPVYATWAFGWFFGLSLGGVEFGPLKDVPEAGLVFLALIFISQVLMVLGCHWSVHIMAWATCTKVNDPKRV